MIALTREAFTDSPGLDTAVSRVLLQRVSDGKSPESLRLYRPLRLVAFGRPDVISPGYPRAAAAGRAAGFDGIERLAGGRAAIYHEEIVAFAWTIPDPVPRERIRQRFARIAGIVAEALANVGVDARIGEVAGEYCPGEWSVNAGGRTKLMGVGQRVVRQASHVGGVIVVDRADLVSDVLVPVYRELGLAWDPATSGSVAGEAPGVTYGDVTTSLVGAFARHGEVVEADIEPDVVEEARTIAAEHESPR